MLKVNFQNYKFVKKSRSESSSFPDPVVITDVERIPPTSHSDYVEEQLPHFDGRQRYSIFKKLASGALGMFKVVG